MVALALLREIAIAVQDVEVHCDGPVREGAVLETLTPKPLTLKP